MTPEQISILLYGHDAHLLELRKWFLHSLGYRVYTAMTVDDFGAIPTDPSISLITLCHTSSQRECEPVVVSALSRWPGIKVLALARDSHRRIPGVGDVPTHLMDAPTHLLSKIGELVGYAGSCPHSHTY